jgi:predicted nucleic acid-binding protein
MYLIGVDDPRKVDAQRVLERLASERRLLVTSSEVLEEILHRYVASGRRDALEPAFEVLRAIVDSVLAVEEADVLAAKDLVNAHPRLSARDAVHAAVMRRHQITEIVQNSTRAGTGPLGGGCSSSPGGAVSVFREKNSLK